MAGGGRVGRGTGMGRKGDGEGRVGGGSAFIPEIKSR